MKEEQKKESVLQKPWLQSLIAIIVIFGALFGFISWQSSATRVKIEDSVLNAPVVNLSSPTAGTLNAIYVSAGQSIQANTPVALVGTGTITSKEAGIVASAPESLGGYFNPGQTVVSVVSTEHMRVRGSIEETKGLSKLAVGQSATFSVDAFPGKTYVGTIDEISATSADTGVAFSISDKRPTQRFFVYVRFNTAEYPELKNGMSAKITVTTK